MRVMRTRKDNGLKPLLPLALMPINMSNLSRDLDEAICYKNVRLNILCESHNEIVDYCAEVFSMTNIFLRVSF